MKLFNVIIVLIVCMCYSSWVIRVSCVHLRVQEREQYMDKTREEHLEQINQCLDRIELDLMAKPDSEDLEFKWEESVANLEAIHDDVIEVKDNLEDVMDSADLEYKFFQMTSKLEEIHDEMKELKDEVAGIKS
jgi:hypothetical protein